MHEDSPFLKTALSRKQMIGLFFLSLLIVAFGQPAFSLVLSILTGFLGYALFFRVILECSTWNTRLLLGLLWFGGVQLIQLSWMLSHPYLYIYGVWLFCALGMGLQFGLVCIFVTPVQLRNVSRLLAIAGLWTLLEGSRLYVLSGFSFNPVGLALSASPYSLQAASVAGIYGLSFWLIGVNLLALKAWLNWPQKVYSCIWGVAAFLPYVYGFASLSWHADEFDKHSKTYKTVLVQTAFPIEETMGFRDRESLVAFVIQEWKKILKITKNQAGKPIDLVVLPEFTVPFGTYSFVYPQSLVRAAFKEIWGPDSLQKLPPLESPWAQKVGSIWFVNNAYWVQAIANFFNAEVLAGLEDVEDVEPNKREYYSSAMHFAPSFGAFNIGRYEKRVLVPMGEYIPFECVRELAKTYGISGSFTPGKEAKILGNKLPLGVSICYEETFANLMRENKVKGAEVLVNLTSDIWYPDSLLPKQHLEHSRLRTVENGLPLLRACNTGVTCAIDSLGRTVASLSEEDQWLADSLYAEVPTYTYKTLYSATGDLLIMCLSAIFMVLFLQIPKEKE